MENGLPTNYGVWAAIELPRGRPDLVVGAPESAFRREPHLAAANRTTARLPWAGRYRRKPTHLCWSLSGQITPRNGLTRDDPTLDV
jgi:hypothetical protein